MPQNFQLTAADRARLQGLQTDPAHIDPTWVVPFDAPTIGLDVAAIDPATVLSRPRPAPQPIPQDALMYPEPRALSPMTVIGVPSAMAGKGYGHLIDNPGDYAGAARAAGRELGQTAYRTPDEQTTPSLELAQRGAPLPTWQALALDIAMDPTNLIDLPVSAAAKGAAAIGIGGMRTFGALKREAALARNVRRGGELAAQRLETQLPSLKSLYREKFGNVISADHAMTVVSPEYNQSQRTRLRYSTPEIHRSASRLASEILSDALAAPVKPNERVLVVAGPPGAGKSKAIERFGTGDRIVVEKAFRTPESADKLIDTIRSSGRGVDVVYADRDIREGWKNGVMSAGRVAEGRMPSLDYYLEAHANAPRVVAGIAARYADDPLVEVVGTIKNGQFTEDLGDFATRQVDANAREVLQNDTADLIKRRGYRGDVRHALENAAGRGNRAGIPGGAGVSAVTTGAGAAFGAQAGAESSPDNPLAGAALGALAGGLGGYGVTNPARLGKLLTSEVGAVGDQPTGIGRLRSRLTDDVLPRLSKSQHPNKVLSVMKNMASPEEADAVGLTQWLKEKGNAPVSKDEVQAFLDQNKLQVNEKWLSGGGSGRSLDDINADIDDFASQGDIGDDPELNEAYEGLIQEQRDAIAYGSDGPQYNREDLQLPGGKNYRELLLTVPEQRAPLAKIDDLKAAGWKTEVTSENPSTGQRSIRVMNPSGSLAMERSGTRLSPDEVLEDYAADRALDESKAAQKKLTYKGPHYKDPNLVMHMRMTDRVLPDSSIGKRVEQVGDGPRQWRVFVEGETQHMQSFATKAEAEAFVAKYPTSEGKMLFIEEAQSDWEKAGQSRGYLPKDAARLEQRRRMIEAIGNRATPEQKQEWSDIMNQLRPDTRDIEGGSGYKGVPSLGPFKGTGWQELGLKRALIEAAEKGYDEVGWTTGRQQSERYGRLLKDIKVLTLSPTSVADDGPFLLSAHDRSGNITDLGKVTTKADVERIAGKTGADKLWSQSGRFKEADFTDEPLTIGSRGMEQQYDEAMPAIVKRLLKKFGIVAERRQIQVPAGGRVRIIMPDESASHWLVNEYENNGVIKSQHRFATESEAVDLAKRLRGGENETVWSVRMTPELKKHILERGFPVAAMAPMSSDDKDSTWKTAGLGALAAAAIGGPKVVKASAKAIATAAREAADVALRARMSPAAKGGKAVVGDFPTSTIRRIMSETKKTGRYAVNLATGDRAKSGLVVPAYPEGHKKNFVTAPGKSVTAKDVETFVRKNNARLAQPDVDLQSAYDPATKQTSLGIVRRFDPQTEKRHAVKFGERAGQSEGYDAATGEAFPIGNWDKFIKSGEFKGRMDEMRKAGEDYLQSQGGQEWWTLQGSELARVYGEDRVKQLAGFLSSTAPNTDLMPNLRQASEYMRRAIKGEPIVQPKYRIPKTAMSQRPGTMLPLERSRLANLRNAESGNLEALSADKVREESMALTGDPEAFVGDRYWAKVSEDPARGVQADVRANVLPPGKPYAALKDVVRAAAKDAGLSTRTYSAQVWTGIRETIKQHGNLFGQKLRTTALGESVGYADLFPKMLASKAKHLKISIKEMEKRLRNGDAELLGLVLSTPIGWSAYQASTLGNE